MVPFQTKTDKKVSLAEMQSVYERLKTPYKHGAVMKFETEACDSPVVFRYKDKWYLSCIKVNYETKTSGYDTHLSESEDLVHWRYLFPILKRNKDGAWDGRQTAGYPAFIQNELYGDYTLQQINGKYFVSYMGGNLDGYETDPLSAGLAKTDDLLAPERYERQLAPILSPKDPDARKGETLTVYKSNMFVDEAQTTGYPFVNAYNAKGEDHRESIFLAVSKDGEKWERYGDKAVLFDNDTQIFGDPQILKLGQLYIMVYFVLREEKAYNLFACSYDLVHWTEWTGKPLIESEYPWENIYAHKPWIVVENGILYHFYCAVNDKKERFIALATSKQL